MRSGSLEKYLEEEIGKYRDEYKKHLFIIDEALKGNNDKFLKTNGVNLLNIAHEKNIRFLFIDANFMKKDYFSSIDSQFTSRCKEFQLTKLSDRPGDTPYIISSRSFEYSIEKEIDIQCIKIDGILLLELIHRTLMVENTRELCNLVDEVTEKAICGKRKEKELILKAEYLNVQNVKKNVTKEFIFIH